NRNSPKVTTVMGRVSSTNTGLTSVLSRPSTSAAMSAAPKDATLMPGRRYATISKATALSIHTSSRVMAASIAVVVGLVRAFNRNVDVIGLFLSQRGQVGAQFLQMQTGNFLVEMLGKDVDLALLILVATREEFNLRNGLVG